MHIIRLRGPWEVTPLARFGAETDALPAAVRVKMPADWDGAFGTEFRGRVRYRRTFQWPAGVEPGERVWLVVEPPRSRGTATLNGEPLGEVRDGGPAGRFDISERVREHNVLEIVVEHDGVPPGGLVGEVRLEVEE